MASGFCFVVFAVCALGMTLIFSTVVRVMPSVTLERRRRWVRGSIRALCRLFIGLMIVQGLMHLRLKHDKSQTLSGEVVVANHPSLIDALLIATRIPNLCCIVKPSLFDNPFMSYVVRVAGYLSSDSPTLLEDAAAAIAAGDNLLIFPEGTRNEDDTTLAFKRGAAHVALAASCPIRPVTIDYHPRTLQRGDRWFDVPPVSPLVVVHVLPALNPSDYPDSNVPVTLAARQLTTTLRELFVRQAQSFTRYNEEPFPVNAIASPDSPVGRDYR